jgi:nucleotide-binding universal stress UspA family protein
VVHAPIPTLVARSCAIGTEVTDTILVPVDDSPECGRAVEIAGRLAAAHGGRVTVMAAPQRDRSLQRAIAASNRVLIQATGAAPRVVQSLPREQNIPHTAASMGATLVILGAGGTVDDRRVTEQIARHLECSILAVPPTRPGSRHRAGRRRRGVAPG